MTLDLLKSNQKQEVSQGLKLFNFFNLLIEFELILINLIIPGNKKFSRLSGGLNLKDVCMIFLKFFFHLKHFLIE